MLWVSDVRSTFCTGLSVLCSGNVKNALSECDKGVLSQLCGNGDHTDHIWILGSRLGWWEWEALEFRPGPWETREAFLFPELRQRGGAYAHSTIIISLQHKSLLILLGFLLHRPWRCSLDFAEWQNEAHTVSWKVKKICLRFQTDGMGSPCLCHNFLMARTRAFHPIRLLCIFPWHWTIIVESWNLKKRMKNRIFCGNQCQENWKKNNNNKHQNKIMVLSLTLNIKA